MPLLGVNIDHVATLRQVRGVNYPCPVEMANSALDSGADFITFHLREDRRHIQDEDCRRLIALQCRSNLEISSNSEMIAIALQLHPSDCCIVPEKRQELTTEGGLDSQQLRRLSKYIQLLQGEGIETSLFIDPEDIHIQLAVEAGAKIVELHSGQYANHPTEQHLAKLSKAITYAKSEGLKVNIGHGITLDLLPTLVGLREVSEYNIGHAIIADALRWGMSETVKKYKKLLS